MKTPNILLIYPSRLYAPFWGERNQIKPHMISLFSFLRYNKINVEVLDIENEIGRPKDEDEVNEFSKKTQELISRFNFDIVAISCWTSLDYLATRLVADICKDVNRQSIIIVGGYHASALPHDFIYDRSPFDFIITGEGEDELLKICKNGKKKAPGPKVISGTPLSLKKQFAIDWKHYKYTSIFPMEYIYLSRGCPYNCSFCMEESKGCKTWRSYSVAEAVEKIKEVIDILKPKQISITDACFGFNRLWRRRFLAELIKHKINVIFWAQTRIDLLDEEDIDLLAKLNFNIEFGLESGSEEMLQIMNKTNKPREYLRKCKDNISYLNKKQVPYHVYLIFNHPGETLDTYNCSIGFFQSMVKEQNKISGLFSAQDYAFFPGTHIYRYLGHYEKKFGTLVKHKEWWKERVDHYELATSIIPSRELLHQREERVLWQQAVSDLNSQCLEKMPQWPLFFLNKKTGIFQNPNEARIQQKV